MERRVHTISDLNVKAILNTLAKNLAKKKDNTLGDTLGDSAF